MDTSYCAKLMVKGQNARKWLNSIFTKPLPQEKGKIQQCFLLNKNGCVIAEFTAYEYINDCFYLISSGNSIKFIFKFKINVIFCNFNKYFKFKLLNLIFFISPCCLCL